MQYNTHLTTKTQRDILLDKKWPAVMIDVDKVINKNCLVWDENQEKYYYQDFNLFFEQLKKLDDGVSVVNSIPESWKGRGRDFINRMTRLPMLYESIKNTGVQKAIMVEQTGERIDGSYRSMISSYLGKKQIPAKIAKFNWKDIDEGFIKRKIAVNKKLNPLNYYQFEYPNGIKNVDTKNETYSENAKDRWDVLKDLIGKGNDVLDLGCNEGYISIMSALQGNKVLGVDKNYINVANFNKLAFEFYNKKDLYLTFTDENILNYDFNKVNLTLALNVLYHLPRDNQIEIMKLLKGKMIIQCNNRKKAEREKYFTSHIEDAKTLALSTGWKIEKEIPWRDKPILIINK